RRRLAAGLVGTARSCVAARRRRARADDLVVGHHRDGAAFDRRAFHDRARGSDRRAGPRRRTQARASRRPARRARAGSPPAAGKRPALPRARFDEDGFYKPGDAVRFVDPAEPAKGIVFDGRLAEDFKLATGTWVAVGVLRVAARAAATPALQDAIVAGENREWIGMLAWLNAAGCRKLPGG